MKPASKLKSSFNIDRYSKEDAGLTWNKLEFFHCPTGQFLADLKDMTQGWTFAEMAVREGFEPSMSY